MTRIFDIEPLEGVGPLRFGMTPADVHEALGEQPRRSFRNEEGDRDEDFPAFGVAYDKETDRLVEVNLTPLVDVRFNGVSLFSDPQAIEVLSQADGKPLEGLGSIVFKRIGIALTDFEGDDPDGRIVGVFQPARWDNVNSLKPYRG